MKKLLTWLWATGIVVLPVTSVVSCSWNQAPISISELGKVMRVVEKQVLNEQQTTKNNIPIVNSEVGLTMPKWPEAEDKTAVGNWNDALKNALGSELASKPTEGNPGGLINQAKNIIHPDQIDPEFANQGLNQTILNNVQAYHFTVLVADLGYYKTEQEEQWIWMSEKSPTDVKVVERNDKPLKNNQREANNGSVVTNEEHYSLLDFMNIKQEVWDEFASNKKNDFQVRFLISFSPKEEEPIGFYVDKLIT